MKKLLLCTGYLFVCLLSSKAQILYGTTTQGGTNNGGTIIKFLPAANSVSAAHSFEAPALRNPESNDFIEVSGKLYGMVPGGGAHNVGGIFSFDPATATFARLKDFDGPRGAVPRGSLVRATDGKLYGTTESGGANNVGVIFSFDPVTAAYVKLKDFSGEDGSTSRSTLVQADNGKLYGTTLFGGSAGAGVIFSFDLATSTYTKLLDFDRTNGAYPYSLFLASNGKLYGMAAGGGTNNRGVIYSFDPATNIFIKLREFNTFSGLDPVGGFMQAANGKLYGTTRFGGASENGVIFSFDITSSTYTRLVSFNGAGAEPFGHLVQATDGKLYGETSRGGSNGYGVIFSLDPLTSTYTVLKSFNQAEGASAFGSLLQASNGKLYGMTYFGGPGGNGTIFSYDVAGSSFMLVMPFAQNRNLTGTSPVGSLMQADNGKLFGVTNSGGSKGIGILYSFDTLTSALTKLHDFDSSSGAGPNGSLVQANNGKIYGMTADGGSNGLGVIYSLDLPSSTYTVLKNFDSTGGAHPHGSLINSNNGKLYGMTTFGGSNNVGVIFSFDPFTSTFAKLYDFDLINGYNPQGSLLQATDGKLYGTTSAGGVNNRGVIFSFDPATSGYTPVAHAISDEDDPYSATLIQAKTGNLYGAMNGGARGTGIIFSYSIAGDDYSEIDVGLTGINDVMQASNGKLYGMADLFSTLTEDALLGIIFSYDFSSLQRLVDFNGANGAVPGNGTFIEVTECTTSTAYYKDADGDGYGNPYNWKIAMSKPSGYVSNNKDCDDRNKSIHPVTYYRDADGDSFGDANTAITICDPVAPAGYARNKSDDDDHRKLEYKIVNSPNPFKETSVIKYALPFDSKVSLKVYDLSGKPVATLVNDNKKAGFYTANFNAAGLSGGILYYRIIADSKDQHFEQTNKMVLLK